MLKLWLNKLGLGFDLRLLGFHTSFYLNQFNWGLKRAVGLRNNTYDGKRLVFLDYDNILYDEMLLPELKYLQETYSLSDFLIFRSSQKKGCFHAVCFSKLPVSLWLKVVNDSSCDEAYKNPFLKDFKTAVLRISPKGSSDAPKFHARLSSVSSAFPLSLAHFNFFKVNHGLVFKPLGDWDDSDELLFVEYPTLNYLKKFEVVKNA